MQAFKKMPSPCLGLDGLEVCLYPDLILHPKCPRVVSVAFCVVVPGPKKVHCLHLKSGFLICERKEQISESEAN